MRIGYSARGYAEKRNFIDLIPDVNYVKINGINLFFARIISVVNRKILKSQFINIGDLPFIFYDFDLNRVDIIHFFNAISFGKTPWVTTFETIVPRFKIGMKCHHGENCGYEILVNDRKITKALEAMAGNACKQLIALSECNFLMQKEFLKYFPQYFREIEPKLIFLHPPQILYVENCDHKNIESNDTINFMFVGGLFFTKGGRELLEVFSELKKKYPQKIKLIIVSSLAVDDYATKMTKTDVDKLADIIDKNRDWVEYYSFLPNNKVLELMRTAHVGLLPTYADTYGYSVLEFQASGCPVISTNVRALPEINNNEAGWLIEVPKNCLGEAIYTTLEERERVGDAIKRGLFRILEEIIENPQIINRKAIVAIERIKRNHSVEVFSKKMSEIYFQALQ